MTFKLDKPLDVDLNEVLDYINMAREATGLPTLAEIPKGVRGEGDICPIAHGVNHNANVDIGEVNFGDPEIAQKVRNVWKIEPEEFDYSKAEWVYPPQVFDDFIRNFDNGFYPQFESGKE